MDTGPVILYFRRMELVLLETLVAVSEMGSFTGAAEKLCVTQSAVSRRIQQLESHFGVTLIDRDQEPITPTFEGQALLSKARRILALQDEMEEAVTGLKTRNRLRFCCTPCFGLTRMPNIFRKMMGGPVQDLDFNVTLRLSEDIVSGLAAGRYDLAAMEHCCDLNMSSCRVYPLAADEMVFISAPALGVEPGEVSLEDLAPLRLFLKAQNGCAHRFLSRSLEEMGSDVSVFGNVTYYDDLRGLVQQVCEGLGIGFVSRELAAPEIKAGRLVDHHLAGMDHMRSRSLLVPAHFLPSDMDRHFLQVLFSDFGLPVPAELA